MSEQVNGSLIKETQDILIKYVKKPPLSEKLLRKPPFRYLHDIITAVIEETGFLDGVFTAEELDSNNVKDKESKIAFLNKLISAVKKFSGANVTVRAAKIVAGLEVNKTLQLLHAIGKAIDEKVDITKNAVQLLESENGEIQDTQKNDEKEKKTNEKSNKENSNESKKIPERVNTVQRTHKQPTQKMDARKKSLEKSDKPRTETTSKNVSESKRREIKAAANSDTKSTAVKHNSISSKSTPVRRPSLRDTKQYSANSKPLQTTIKEEKEMSNDTVERKKEMPGKDNKNETKNSQSTEESKPKKEQDNRMNGKSKENEVTVRNEKNTRCLPKDDEKQEKSPVKRRESIVQRPGSARPGSRKLIHNDEHNKTTPKETAEANENDQKNEVPSLVRPRTANRPASARPGAPRIRDRGEVAAVEEPKLAAAPVNVIEEGKQDQFMDDKDSFIVIETEKAPLQSNDTTRVDETEQGQLVHQILKTQKELNESVVVDKSQNKQLQIEWEAGRQAEKDLVSEEIEKIRKFIQILTSAANPLGKLFDFLQEDVDEMQRELQHWRNVNEKLRKHHKSELELGKTLLQPLQKQLSDVENSIEEEYFQIANIKMIVLNNEERILKLVANNSPKIRIK